MFYFNCNSLLICIGDPAKRENDCMDCPGGYKCGQATVDLEACGKGMFSKIKQFECKTCQIGSAFPYLSSNYFDISYLLIYLFGLK